jgi:hypothetical protein
LCPLKSSRHPRKSATPGLSSTRPEQPEQGDLLKFADPPNSTNGLVGAAAGRVVKDLVSPSRGSGGLPTERGLPRSVGCRVSVWLWSYRVARVGWPATQCGLSP